MLLQARWSQPDLSVKRYKTSFIDKRKRKVLNLTDLQQRKLSQVGWIGSSTVAGLTFLMKCRTVFKDGIKLVQIMWRPTWIKGCEWVGYPEGFWIILNLSSLTEQNHFIEPSKWTLKLLPDYPFWPLFFLLFSYFTGTCLLKVHALCMMLVASHDRNCNNNLSIVRSVNPKFPLAKRCYRGFVQEAEHLGSVGWPLAQRPAVSAWLLSGPWWEGCSVDNLPNSSRNNDERWKRIKPPSWAVCQSYWWC